MPIGSTQRDSRRRRVLLDDKQEEAAPKRRRKSADSSDSGTPEKLYTDAAMVDHHLPISSMVPKKFWMLSVIALGLISIVVGLNFLDGCCQSWSEKYGAQQVMAFDMIAGKGIVKWLSSFLLAVASLYCIQVYLIRRHRSDDYRGSYRMWGWLAGALLLLSLNATAGISELFLNLARDFAREQTGFNNPVVWTAIILLPITICLLRVFFEIRESKSAIAALLLSSGAFLLAMLLDNNLMQLEFAPQANSRIVHCNLVLIGYVSLFLSSAVYSRFVFMDSQGLLAGKSLKRSERATARQEKRQQREALKTGKREAKQQEREKSREETAAKDADRKQKSAADRKAREEQKLAAKAKSQKSRKQEKPPAKAADKSASKSSGPLSNRSSKRTKLDVNRKSDPARTIPDFQEIKDDEPTRDRRPSTISIEDMQRKMAASKNRSERKRLKKMIEAQQRRAA